jgi:transcription antitermination factor NusG
MPILVPEPSIFPSQLLDAPELADSETPFDDVPWWVFHTKARQEKSLARDLLLREIGFYLPVVPRRLLIRGRAVHSYVPLFAGYLFVRCSDEDRLRALMTNRVARVLPVVEAEQLRRDLLNIRRLIHTGASLTVEARLEPNQRVRIRAGALAGMEGTILKRKNELRLVVGVMMLKQGVSLEIDDYLLEPLD